MREEYIMIKQTWSSNWSQIDGISVEPVDQALHVGAEKVSVWLPMLPFIGSNIPSFFSPWLHINPFRPGPHHWLNKDLLNSSEGGKKALSENDEYYSLLNFNKCLLYVPNYYIKMNI